MYALNFIDHVSCVGEKRAYTCIGIGIRMWGAAALSLTSDVPLATGNGGPRGLCHRKPDGRHMCSASRSWEMGG